MHTDKGTGTMKKILPRHAAGSVDLKEGTGPITAMCPCGNFLEIYKIDKTFRVKTPETIDPAETNPSCPWIASPVSDVGSANRIVARVLLQGYKILEAAMLEGNVSKEAVVEKLHACKESLVACENVAKKVVAHIERIIDEINSKGVSKDNAGRAINPFPQVPNLEIECATFLVQANRTIKLICELPSLFLSLDRADSNLDHLGKRLENLIGSNVPLTEFVTANTAEVRYLIDLRNFHEHPNKIKTEIDNFTLMPDAKIQVPMWHISNEPPRPIKEEMLASITFLIQLAEAMLIHLVMHKVSKQAPYIVVEVPDTDVDPNVPIKYRLSIDLTKLKMA
jgi:hypothetical protein